jgi:P-type E1-E2 ATPase
VAQTLKELSPAKTLLLSGDGKKCVQFVANQCRFVDFLAEATPLDKREKIEQLKCGKQIVCMVGDGINDAPALTSANVGISVLSASDISIQVSDILLTTDHLGVIPKLRTLAIKGRRIIHQNLFWAFFYNVIGIGLAAFGWLSPIFAAFAMVASSLIVLFNAQRLKTKEKV